MLARRSHYLVQTCKRDGVGSLQVFPSNMRIKLVVFYTIFLLAFAFLFVQFITSIEGDTRMPDGQSWACRF